MTIAESLWSMVLVEARRRLAPAPVKPVEIQRTIKIKTTRQTGGLI